MIRLGKVLFLFFLSIFSFTFSYAQSLPPNTCGIVYSYDAAGNRTQRIYICNNGTAALTASVLKEYNSPEIVQVSSLYPNPTTGLFRVNFTIPLKDAQIILTDLGGHTLQQRSASGSQIDFDVSKFPAGIYLVRIKHDNGLLTFKVIKK